MVRWPGGFVAQPGPCRQGIPGWPAGLCTTLAYSLHAFAGHGGGRHAAGHYEALSQDPDLTSIDRRSKEGPGRIAQPTWRLRRCKTCDGYTHRCATPTRLHHDWLLIMTNNYVLVADPHPHAHVAVRGASPFSPVRARRHARGIPRRACTPVFCVARDHSAVDLAPHPPVLHESAVRSLYGNPFSSLRTL